MLDSTIIEIDGVFLGTAIAVGREAARRFYAAHDSVRVMHNETLPSLQALRHMVATRFRREGGLCRHVAQIETFPETSAQAG